MHTRLTALVRYYPGEPVPEGKTNLDFTEARDSEWQWHQLGRMQVCTSLQTDDHASTRPLSFYRQDALPATQQHGSTEGKNEPIWIIFGDKNPEEIWHDCFCRLHL